MLKRTLIGGTLVAVVLGAWASDSARPGEPAWVLAALGIALTLGALFELVTIFPDAGAQAADPQVKRSSGARTAVLMATGVLWVAVIALAGLSDVGFASDPSVTAVVRQLAYWLLISSLLTVPLVLARLKRGPGKSMRRLARRASFVLPYACGLSALVFILLQGRVDYIVGLVLVSKSSDIGAYFVGKTMGRRKLAPSISPNKTVEGMLGGLVLPTLLAAWLLADVEVTLHLHDADIVRLPGGSLGAACHGFAVGALVVLSDLSESLIKRSFAVKDSGSLFGESGGFLDLADSLLLVAPVALAYTAFLT
ncbi:MAG: phosphatidate cytidylyltransferase [Planctomycetota bacterium]|nr:phosphatidate cytidylyltransferase [Planctomycetota bacterium]